jgi:hypothetical protein
LGLAQFRDGRLKIFSLHTNNSEIHAENIFRGVRLVLRLYSLQCNDRHKTAPSPDPLAAIAGSFKSLE